MFSSVRQALHRRLDASSVFQRYRALPLLIQRLLLVGSSAFVVTLALTIVYFFVSPVIAAGVLASILAGLATGVGALPALCFRNVSQRLLYIMLGFAAGVLLAATAFSLLVPGIDYGNRIWPGKGIFVVSLGLLAGAGFLELADRFLPYERFLAKRGNLISSLRKVWLFIAAITLHNFPEGMAVGVSFGGGDWHNGLVIAIAIGLQNIVEGLAVALPLVGLGYRRGQAVFIATLTGLVEPVGGFLGVAAVSFFSPLLPIGMAFAAGAMLLVIADDIIPETQSKGKARSATFAFVVGFVVMMVLDNLLG